MIEKLEQDVSLVRRHFEVFRTVWEHQPVGIVNLTKITDYPHHKIRYSLRVLEEEGLIEPTDQGAITTETAHEFLSEHPRRIDDLIEQLRTNLKELEPLGT